MGICFLGRAMWPLGLVAIGAVQLAGCSSTGGLGLLHPYLVASDDTCGEYKTELRSYRDYFFTAIAEGAGIGAAVGGLTSYLAGGSTKTSLLSAGAGGIIGGVGGYYLAKVKAANGDRTKLADSVYDDVSKENHEIDGATAAFQRLRDCRLGTARTVKRDLARHRLSRDEADKKLQQIHDWFEEDIDFADALGAKMDERGKEYANASDQMLNTNAPAQRAVTRHETAHGESAGGLVAREAARVRAKPTTDSAEIALLSRGETVTPLSADNGPADWTHVQLDDGRTGYVARRLLVTGAAARAGGPPPPKNVAGVAELTESNQLKRHALKDDIAEAKNEASGSTFELNGGISRMRPAPVPRAAA